jgi:hypothetical protein
VSGPERVPPVVEQLIRTVVGGTDADRDERASTFARGLALGALVGAAIAGSTIWQRRLARQRQAAPVTEIEVDVAAPDAAASAASGGIAP